MGEVIDFNPAANPDVVLKEAMGDFDSVLILGYNHEGFMEARGSLNLIAKADLLLLVENFKYALMSGAYDDE